MYDFDGVSIVVRLQINVAQAGFVAEFIDERSITVLTTDVKRSKGLVRSGHLALKYRHAAFGAGTFSRSFLLRSFFTNNLTCRHIYRFSTFF